MSLQTLMQEIGIDSTFVSSCAIRTSLLQFLLQLHKEQTHRKEIGKI